MFFIHADRIRYGARINQINDGVVPDEFGQGISNTYGNNEATGTCQAQIEWV